MKLEIEFNNLSKSPITANFLKKVIKETLSESQTCCFQGKTLISLASVSEKEMKNLNGRYRGISKITDVLSFSENHKIGRVTDKEIFLGEIIVCYDDIKKYSQEKKINLEEELAKVISHGTLHLLGFKHGKKMFSIQKKVARKISGK